MEIIIFAVIVGSGIAYFATQNTDLISLHLGPYLTPEIPLYFVLIGTLLLGLLLSWIFSLFNLLSSKMTLHGKQNEIKRDAKTIAELSKQIHQLELENIRLKEKSGEGDNDNKSL